MDVLGRRRQGLRALAVCVVLTIASRVLAAGDLSNVRLANREVARRVRSAVEGAGRRLADPGCQRVFSDFTDQSGRRLLATLRERGAAAERYSETVFFYDGSGQPRCARGDVMAFTFPTSRVIFVCGVEFSRAHPATAEVIVIHEMLHTLGLGENPPSSFEITSRVLSRCGG